MTITIRKPRLEPIVDGMPEDFHDIMTYFNWSLAHNHLSYVPRRNPITKEEIMNKWVPSLETNISFVAERNEMVVGSLTVFYDTNSTAYEHANQRLPGEIGSTVAHGESYSLVMQELLSSTIAELRRTGKTATATFASENRPLREVFKRLKYKGRTSSGQERYQKIGLSGKVIKISLP